MDVVKTPVALQREALEKYLREALVTEASLDAPSVLGGLAETVTLLPLVFMALLLRAARTAKANPPDITVIDCVSKYGCVFAVCVRDVRIAEVSFVLNSEGGFTINAHLHLTPAGVELIDQKEDER